MQPSSERVGGGCPGATMLPRGHDARQDGAGVVYRVCTELSGNAGRRLEGHRADERSGALGSTRRTSRVRPSRRGVRVARFDGSCIRGGRAYRSSGSYRPSPAGMCAERVLVPAGESQDLPLVYKRPTSRCAACHSRKNVPTWVPQKGAVRQTVIIVSIPGRQRCSYLPSSWQGIHSEWREGI